MEYMETIPVFYNYKEKQRLEKKIKAILKRGNIVCFTHKINGIVKHLNEWNIDDMGDLKAFYSTGHSPYIAWDVGQYDITEIINDKSS